MSGLGAVLDLLPKVLGGLSQGARVRVTIEIELGRDEKDSSGIDPEGLKELVMGEGGEKGAS